MLRKTLSWVLAVLLMFAAASADFMKASAAEKYDMPYYIEVDIRNQITTVYRTSDDAVLRQCLCTTGTDEFYTPYGTFYLPAIEDPTERTEWFYFRMYGSWAKYATRIFRGILFHSLIFDHKDAEEPTAKSVEELGIKASHGCIRLRVDDAKWIAENCMEGTRVFIFRNGDADEDLRELLLFESYAGLAGEDGLTYEQFMGLTKEEGVLGRGSEGAKVLDLQYRLQSLGFFNGELNGKYKSSTVKAVRAFKQAEGLLDSGVVDAADYERIFASDAAIGTMVPIEFSMNGPAVSQLQRALADLHLYSGPVDSVYDADVQEAVRAFQGACGYDYDEVCQPEIQQGILNAAEQVKKVFNGKNYTSDIVTQEYDAARIIIDVSVRLREEPSTAAIYLEKLEPGARVLVEERLDDGWSHLRSGTNEGYIKDEYLEFYSYENINIHYTSDDGSVTFTLGQTPEEYLMGELDAAAAATLNMMEVRYATVNTGSDDITLNLRSQPSVDGEVLAKLSNGLELPILGIQGEWTKVEYEGQEGYLMNQYVAAETRSEVQEIPVIEGYEEDMMAEVTTAQEGVYLGVREIDSADSPVVGQLKDGTIVQILHIDDNWAYVQYEGNKGYVLARYLSAVQAEQAEAAE